jgi:hypothetical protein
MSRGRQYVEFEGLFSESVLGIFRIIRGLADLRDLAAVSVPYKMEDGEQGFRVLGHQRVESAKHAEEIKSYLEQSENRFLPEVILSVRAPVKLMVNRGEIDPVAAAKQAKDAEQRKALQKEIKDYLKAMEIKQITETRQLLKERFDYPIFMYEAEKIGISATGEEDQNELYPNDRQPADCDKTCLEWYREFRANPDSALGAGE